MTYNEVIYLVSQTKSATQVDSYGDPVITDTKKMVFASVGSIGMKEFYQAQTAGLKPEIQFTIADYYDYGGQMLVEYNDVRYKVLRTYRTERNELNIVCHEGVRNVSA